MSSNDMQWAEDALQLLEKLKVVNRALRADNKRLLAMVDDAVVLLREATAVLAKGVRDD